MIQVSNILYADARPKMLMSEDDTLYLWYIMKN